MTTQEIVNGHKFRNPAIERIVREYANTGTIDVDAYDKGDLTEILVEFAKDRARWAKSNAAASERSRAGRLAERDAKSTYARLGGKSPRPTLTDAERNEWESARNFLSRLGYDV